jgi:DoxX-like protein
MERHHSLSFFMERTGTDFFVNIGYTHAFHLFIMSAEILGGAALLLPWRWLTLVAVADLTIDMSGALLNHIRSHDSLDVAFAAIVIVLRLLPLALLTVKGRWRPIAAVALACIGVALAGDALTHGTPGLGSVAKVPALRHTR